MKALLEKQQQKKLQMQLLREAQNGNCERKFTQNKYDPNNEASRKISLRPDKPFNPDKIHTYITPPISLHDQLITKDKLTKCEQIIFDNLLLKKKKEIQTDFEDIEIYGLSAKPTTIEGRTKLLLETLRDNVKKKNNNIIINIHLRLLENEFIITDELKLEYNKELDKMKGLVDSVDIIKLQFTEFYSSMPPLNQKGFKKLDEWQIQVINNIDNKVSTIVNAPTSAGKTVLAGYTITKGNCLFIVPTDALVWQVSAYLETIKDSFVPILTKTYQSHPNRDEMIKLLNNSSCIIGTPETIVDYLPFITLNFNWLIFDEVHMIGSSSNEMEHIFKVFNNIPFLALSATIENTDEIINWLKTFTDRDINRISCNKRFFNLDRYSYNNENLQSINLLGFVKEQDIIDKSLLEKSFQVTPPIIYDLYIKLNEHFDMDELNIDKYFDKTKRIELDKVNIFFEELLKFIIVKYEENKEIIMNIINSYKHTNLLKVETDLTKLCFKLKEINETPVIIFHKNTLEILKYGRKIAKDLDRLENEKYPKLIDERIKLENKARRIEKNSDNDKDVSKDKDKDTSKKDKKALLGNVKLKKDGYNECSISHNKEEEIVTVALQEPHPDFTLTNGVIFNESEIESYVSMLKKYFPNTGEYYHYIIKLLWRGVGIYAIGLPEQYLRLIQTLACSKKLAIVLSDMSLVFGVSMPFRTVVILNDDTLDNMTFLQMCGRAGRRGLDKKGNIIFAGFSWNRIEQLTVSKLPIVKGVNNITYTFYHATELSKINNNNQNWDLICDNFLDGTDNNDVEEFRLSIISNYEGGWNFAFEQNINHLFMNWRMRNGDNLIVCYLIKYIRRAFECLDSKVEKNQIEIARFLCNFISIEEASDELKLESLEILEKEPYNNILPELHNLDIILPDNIDSKLYLSIQRNLLFDCEDIDVTDKLRSKLYDFGIKIIYIQNYCYQEKYVGLCKLLSKLVTRIWWIYHNSSPVMIPLTNYEK